MLLPSLMVYCCLIAYINSFILFGPSQEYVGEKFIKNLIT
jgi:hypothetical protein